MGKVRNELAFFNPTFTIYGFSFRSPTLPLSFSYGIHNHSFIKEMVFAKAGPEALLRYPSKSIARSRSMNATAVLIRQAMFFAV